MIKILVAEDDKDLNRLVCTYLLNKGYEVCACLDGEKAIDEICKNEFSLVISDIMMPGADGYEVAKVLREKGQTPLIFITAKEDKQSQLLGYGVGVDDYIIKPFDPDVLMLKVAALLRRAGIEESKELVVGNLVMKSEEYVASVDGEELSLSVREFNLLFKLLSYPKKTFTRSALMAEFWDYDSSATSRTVDVYMAKLRDKTSACDGFEILTVHGLGYKAVLK